MRQFKFTYHGKAFLVILREHPKDISKELLEKIAAHCFQFIAKQEQEDNEKQFRRNLESNDWHYRHNEIQSGVIYIKRFWLPASGDPKFQFVFTTDKNSPSSAIITSIELNSDFPEAFNFNHELPELEEKDLPPELDTSSQHDTNEWVLHPPVLKRYLSTREQLPVILDPIPFVTDWQANHTPYHEIILNLCRKLGLSAEDTQRAQHLLTKSLFDEFATLDKNPDMTSLYRSWVDKEVRQNELIKFLPVSDKLLAYIDKQATAAQATIAAAKSAALQAYIRENDKKYQHKIADMQQHEYLAKLNRFHYIRTNIMIALYNAAQKSYNALIQKYNDDHKKDVNKLKADIQRFNASFKCFAKINLETLRLTPLQRLLDHLANLPALTKCSGLTSLEQFVDHALELAAEDETAFTAITHELEQLHLHTAAAQGANPTRLFNPIDKPTVVSKLKTKILYPIGKEKKKEHFFELTSVCSELEASIEEAEKQFPIFLDFIKVELAGYELKIMKMLQAQDQAFDALFERKRANIAGYQWVLDKAKQIDKNIDALLVELAQLQATLTATDQQFRKLSQIQRKYNLPSEAFSLFKRQFFGEDIWDEPSELLSRIPDIKDQAESARKEAASVVEHAGEGEVLDNEKTNPHLYKLISLELQKLDPCSKNTGLINKTIKTRCEDAADLKNWTYASKRIDVCMPIIANCESATKTLIDYGTSLNQIINYHFIYQNRANFASTTDRTEVIKRQIESFNLAITTNIAELAKETSDDNCLVQALKDKQSEANQLANAALQKYNRDMYDLARCNLAMKAILDFEYWHNIASPWECRVNIRDRRQTAVHAGNYKVPEVILALFNYSCLPTCKEWDVNPEHARNLMTHLRTLLTDNKVGQNLAGFKALMCRDIIHKAGDEIPDIKTLEKPRAALTQLMRRRDISPPLQRRPLIHEVTLIPHVFEKHPERYRALVGALVGVLLVTAAALICLGLIYGGAVPALGVAAGAVLTVGGPALLTFLAVVSAAVTASVCAFVNTVFNCGRQERPRARNRTISNAVDDDFRANPGPAAAPVNYQPPQEQALGFGPASVINAQQASKDTSQMVPAPRKNV